MNNVRRWALVLALGTGIIVSIGPVLWAAGAERPCMEDVKRLCPEAKTKQEIRNCMKMHKDELSDACKEKMATAKKKIQGIRQACADDLKKFCGDVQAGRGRKLKCLKEHEADLSPSCREAMQKKS